MSEETTYLKLASGTGVFQPRSLRDVKFVNRSVLKFEGDLPAEIEQALGYKRLVIAKKSEYDAYQAELKRDAEAAQSATKPAAPTKKEESKPAEASAPKTTVSKQFAKVIEGVVEEGIEHGVLNKVSGGFVKYGEKSLGRGDDLIETLASNAELFHTISTEVLDAKNTKEFDAEIALAEESLSHIDENDVKDTDTANAWEAIKHYRAALAIMDNETASEAVENLVDEYGEPQ